MSLCADSGISWMNRLFSAIFVSKKSICVTDDQPPPLLYVCIYMYQVNLSRFFFSLFFFFSESISSRGVKLSVYTSATFKYKFSHSTYFYYYPIFFIIIIWFYYLVKCYFINYYCTIKSYKNSCDKEIKTRKQERN